MLADAPPAAILARAPLALLRAKLAGHGLVHGLRGAGFGDVGLCAGRAASPESRVPGGLNGVQRWVGDVLADPLPMAFLGRRRPKETWCCVRLPRCGFGFFPWTLRLDTP